MAALALAEGTRVWLLLSGTIGHETNCRGVAAALGLAAIERTVTPRKIFRTLSPWGPADPHDARAVLSPPFPDIAIAAGRVTVPYLRRLKRLSPRTFTVFLQDPRTGARTGDLIWVPEHDRLRGANVLTTLVSPHPLTPQTFAAARAHPDPRIARLKPPRLALVLGGPSGAHRFTAQDEAALQDIASAALREGMSVMITPSRRTPPEVLRAIAERIAREGADADRAFLWDGAGDNPYAQMLARADRIVVTGDSVNMMGEAVATGVPVHIYEPGGGAPKITAFIERLVQTGAARRWNGVFATWSYEPLDATATIASEIVKRYAAFRGASLSP